MGSKIISYADLKRIIKLYIVVAIRDIPKYMDMIIFIIYVI